MARFFNQGKVRDRTLEGYHRYCASQTGKARLEQYKTAEFNQIIEVLKQWQKH